jgi:hypothetical protein
MAGVVTMIATGPAVISDREWVQRFLRDRWESERMAAHGALYYPAEQAGFLALHDEEPVGLVTYVIQGLRSPSRGAGT